MRHQYDMPKGILFMIFFKCLQDLFITVVSVVIIFLLCNFFFRDKVIYSIGKPVSEQFYSNGNYYYINDAYHTNNLYEKYDNYDVYFLDTETKTLYFFHNNI